MKGRMSMMREVVLKGMGEQEIWEKGSVLE